jgi:hypothetical protein
MQTERRQTVSLSNDLLLQIIEHQHESARVLGEIRSDITNLAGPEGRIKKLENSQTLNWWMTYVVTPCLLLARSIAHALGAKV